MRKRRPTIEELRQKLQEMEFGGSNVVPITRLVPAFNYADDDEDDDDWDDDDWEDGDVLGDVLPGYGLDVDMSQQWSAVRSDIPLSIPSDILTKDSWNIDFQRFQKRQLPLSVASPPSRFDEILKWQSDNALQHTGNITLQALQRWQYFNHFHCRYSDRLVDILKSPRGSRKHKVMQQNGHFLEAVRQYLSFWAKRKAAEDVRQHNWATINISPDFNDAVKTLRTLREELLRFPSSLEPHLHQKSDLLIPDGLVGFGVEFVQSDEGYYASRHIISVFHAVDDSHYGIDCSCGDLINEPCPHVRILVEWLLDVLGDPEEPAHALLLERIRTPFWKFSFDQLRDDVDVLEKIRASSLVASSSERLAWRINSDRDGYTKEIVEPILQSRGKNGRWSKGRRVSESEWRARHLQPMIHNHSLLQKYIGILWEKEHSDSGSFPERLCEFLKRLEHEPRVFLQADKSVPIKVIVQKVVFAVVPSDNGVRTTLRMGNLEISGDAIGARMISPFHMHDIDLQEGTFTLGEISESTYPFVRFCTHTSRELPAEAVSELFSLMSQAENAEVWVHPTLRGKTVPPDVRIVARVVPQDDFDYRLSLHVYPTGSGAAYAPGAGPKELIREVDGTRMFVDRDLEGEIEAAEAVANELHLSTDTVEPFNWYIDTPEKSLDVLALLNQLPDVVVEWPKDATPLRVLRAGTPSLKVTARQKQNWFLIGGTVTVDNTDVSFKELLRAVRKKQRFVRLKKGEYLILQKELYDKLAVMGGLGGVESGGTISVPQSGIPFMEQQLQDLSFHGGKGWDAVKKRIAEAADLSPEVPATFNGELRPYQKDGFAWLSRLSYWSGGACLADDMGLGKTLQTLALILWRDSKGPSIIISPMSVCHNWISEASVFAPTLDIRLYHGAGREAALQQITDNTILVTSYDTLSTNMNQLEELQFDLMVMDEAQMIKNALSKRAKAVAQINANFRLALTGTPVENHLGDLWSIFHAIIPGLLGSFEQFRRQYAVPIERDSNPRARELLKQLVAPFLLRRNKAMVLPDLPPRIETISQVELGDKHMALYDDARQRILEELLAENGPPGQKRFSALAGLTRLRRLACHPRLVDDTATLGSAKMERILETIQDLVAQDQRALIFSQFTSHLSLLQQALQRIGVGYLYLDGSTSQPMRKKRVAQWHEGEAPLFIISLKAGGFGLNLTGADYVLHLDPWWNPATEDQATDRTHRIGQLKPVTVVRFIACDTVEQGVVALHEQKRELAESILGDAANSKQLSPEELISLIRGE